MILSINLLIAFLWFLSAIIDYVDFCYIWQLKEYRWDRMRDFLSTEQGKYYWIRWQLLWRSLIAIVIFFWPFNDDLTIKYILIALFAIDLLRASYKLHKSELRHPKLTKKAILIILASIIAEGCLFIFTKDWTILLLLLILRFFTLSGMIFILNRFTDAIKTYYTMRASKKIAQYQKLVVIGVTGSYGKTSVKNYLSHILSAKFNIISTPEHVNTDIGVALFILGRDFDNKDIFIVEMGAYKIGEIKKICDMVHPRIGILTAISEQHLSLFGSILNTQKAKYELLESLPPDGLAIVNGDNSYCIEKLHTIQAKSITFGINENNQHDYIITDIKSGLNGTTWRGFFRDQVYESRSPLIGEHTAINVAPCAIVAWHLGLQDELIQKQIETLPQNIKIVESWSRTIIDDTYNSNPAGFNAALDILNKFPSDKKRIIITRGMLELGEKSDKLHEQVAENISLVADELVLITTDFVKPMQQGLLDKYRTNFVLKDNPAELLKYVKELRGINCVILLENRVPTAVRQELGLI